MQQQVHWQAAQGAESTALRGLEAAWAGWGQGGRLPSRALFDPMDFPDLLPWMVLGEVVPPAAKTMRGYDILLRYLGSEFERYFKAGSLTRIHISDVGAPYTERWFAVYDAVIAKQRPLYFTGAPFGTGYEYLPLEMLALPLAKIDTPDIGFVLFAFARLEIA
ncbi:MAG: hypothetical protein HYU58_11585 [Proteobacteria bacterium]|nr:hypothetical protein [Pseudomonadota bacterium]